MRTAIVGIVLVAAAGAAATSALPATTPAPSGVQSGKTLYARYGCYQCHGFAGQGSILSGPPLAKRKLTVAYVERYVRSPFGVMPAYSARLLPDAPLRAIALHVASLESGRPATQIVPLARFKQPAAPPSGGRTPR